MELYLIKDNDEKKIIINEDISKEIKNPRSKLLKKYVNEEGYSLIAFDKDDKFLNVCISENVTLENKEKMISVIYNLTKENKIYSFQCFNYLNNGDYDAVHRLDKYSIVSAVAWFHLEKINKDCEFTHNYMDKFRTLDLEKCLINEEPKEVPNNKNSGVILISKNNIENISLTKRTHAEVIEEYTKKTETDLYTKENTIVIIVSKNLLFIEIPDKINNYQKEELEKINNIVQKVKNNYNKDVFVDIYNNNKTYKDLYTYLSENNHNHIKRKISNNN